MTAAYGWYEHAQDPLSITNGLTGQRLTVMSRVEAGDVVKWQARYQDPDLDLVLPLILRQGTAGRASAQLDYRWIFPGIPDQGTWRRLDDFLTDALLAWSPSQGFEAAHQYLVVLGGWQGGLWHADWRREFSASRDLAPGTDADVPPSPLMQELTAPASWPWRYTDVESPASEVDWTWVDGRPHGFQSKVPCLEREGPPAWLFPSRLEPELHRGEDPMGLIYYTLAEAGHACTFRHHPFARLGLLYLSKDKESSETPSYQDWKRIASTLVDAWSSWRAPPRIMRAPADPPWDHPFGFSAQVGEPGLGIKGGFVAGLLHRGFELHLPTPAQRPHPRQGALRKAERSGRGLPRRRSGPW